jgi:hypothetical protein
LCIYIFEYSHKVNVNICEKHLHSPHVNVFGCVKAHFTLRVKVKVKFKSSIPIGAITEIGVKGFTIRVKAEK